MMLFLNNEIYETKIKEILNFLSVKFHSAELILMNIN
jgi:hypothetical protein